MTGKQKGAGCKVNTRKTELSGCSKQICICLQWQKNVMKSWQQWISADFDTRCNYDRVVRKDRKTIKKLVAKPISDKVPIRPPLSRPELVLRNKGFCRRFVGSNRFKTNSFSETLTCDQNVREEKKSESE